MSEKGDKSPVPEDQDTTGPSTLQTDEHNTQTTPRPPTTEQKTPVPIDTEEETKKEQQEDNERDEESKEKHEGEPENDELKPAEHTTSPDAKTEAVEPEMQTKETVEPSTQMEEAVEPENNTEDATGPETKTEEATEPENKTEQATGPENKTEEATEPETKTEETTEPENETEQATGPENKKEEATEPEIKTDAPKEENEQEATQEMKKEEPGTENMAQEPETDAVKPPFDLPKVDKEVVPVEQFPKQQSPEPSKDDAGMGTEATQEVHEVDPHAVSPEPKVDTDANATVKFVMMPSGQVATLRCQLSQNLGELKDHFAAELKMDADMIMLMFDGKSMENKSSLADLGVGANGTVQLEMTSADPVNNPLKPFKTRQEYHMPDVITVRVQTDDGSYKDVIVEIERPTKKKPFLGGYRHKKTGVEFHHAWAQTAAKLRPPSLVDRFCRDTQTAQQNHIRQQTTSDTSTQMTSIGVYVSNMEDKLVIPGKYTTADEYHRSIFMKVIIIQKYYRRWLAKRYVTKVREDKERRLEWERQEEIRKKKEKEDRIRKEFERRMNPKSKEDFDLLYHALEKWRQEELETIDRTLTGAERKAALCQLLEQETQLIASVGKHKIEANQENKQKSIQAFLDKASAPKKWKAYDGKTTEMDTSYTIRAQQLKDIYNSINMKYLTQDERLDVLLTLKHTVKEHDCKLTQEIIELIDREADLLMRGVKDSNLDGLRKRISTLFLQYVKTPVFNPEAARLLKVPQDPSSLRKNIYFCPSCNQYLPSTEFQLSSNSRVVGKCRSCNKIDNDARVRQDYSHFRFMLKNLRKSEEAFADGSKIAFLLQENDLRYLVENVWNGQSILSAWEDLYDLVLVRWEMSQEWAPWNCILLTKEEASAHQKLEDLVEGYGMVFIHRVQHKHTMAQNYFSRLPGMAEQMRRAESGKTNSHLRGPSVAGRALPIQPSSA